MTHPVIPVYFMTANRKAAEFSVTRYVVMKPQEYDAVVRYTHASQCSPNRIMAGPSDPRMIVVSELSGKLVRDVCVFPRGPGCQYLFGLANLHDVDWSHKDTYPLFEFETELGCKGSLTPSHDATGRSD